MLIGISAKKNYMEILTSLMRDSLQDIPSSSLSGQIDYMDSLINSFSDTVILLTMTVRVIFERLA